MGFDSYHPAIQLAYFVSVLAGTALLGHPVFLAVSFFCAWAYCVTLNGRKGAIFGLLTLLTAPGAAAWYAASHHFGVTVLWVNAVGNRMTLEALLCGASRGIMIAGILLWFACIHRICTTDKVVYLFSRISPRLGLFAAVLLRTVPRAKYRLKKTAAAQRGIGRGVGQGNILRRLRHGARIFSILVTWQLESFSDVGDAMKSRGAALRGRTAYALYRFHGRDRAMAVAFTFCTTALGVGYFLGYAYIAYDPRVICAPATPVSVLLYVLYAVFCLLPVLLQIAGEIRFEQSRTAPEEAAAHGVLSVHH